MIVLDVPMRKRKLPFTDTFARANGAVGNGWTGATWTIASNQVSNTPTLGAELFTTSPMPTLEDTYTDGLCAGLSKNGSPTVSQSADTYNGSTKAQAFQGQVAANYLTSYLFSKTSGKFYRYSTWHKRLSGTQGRTVSVTSTTLYGSQVQYLNSDGAYAIRSINYRADNTTQYTYPAWVQDAGPWDSLVIGALSLKQHDETTIYLVKDFRQSNVLVQAVLATMSGFDGSFLLPVGQLSGLVLCLDSVATHLNCLIAYHDGVNVYLDKQVNGTWTNLLKVAATWGSTKQLKVTKSGTTVKLFYDGIQCGADQTVSDAGTINNTLHGLFSLGGVSFSSFFADRA